ncbi:MAG: hypothetical protein WDO18_03850 [Acidobacteriota bacterium]
MITRRTFLFAPLALAFPQSTESLTAGFVLLYHLRFADARAIFIAWQRSHPNDPMGFSAEAASHLFEEFEQHGVLTTAFFLDDDLLLGGIKDTPNAARTRAFEQANERARSLSDSQLKGDPQQSNALLARTLSAGMLADYDSIIAKEQLASLRQIRAAEGFAERLLAVAPQIGDAYMALGAANYILACLPSYKRAVLWFGGMQGSKPRGMEQLARAAKDGAYLGPYAKILLAFAYLREKRGLDAQRLMVELTTAFPDSPLFARERANIDRIVTKLG